MRGSEEKGKFRIGVIGGKQVGKSALAVRYLTKRFIGEYHSDTDMLYHQALPGHGTFELEIVDQSSTAAPASPLFDAIILVYSITDRASLQFASEALSTLSTNPIRPPIVLIANKSDLEHLREVERREGHALAAAFGLTFHELSVADNSPEVFQSFTFLINTFLKPRRRFSFSRLFLRIGKMSLAQKQSSDSTSATGSENSFDGNLSSRTSPKLWNFRQSPQKSFRCS